MIHFNSQVGRTEGDRWHHYEGLPKEERGTEIRIEVYEGEAEVERGREGGEWRCVKKLGKQRETNIIRKREKTRKNAEKIRKTKKKRVKNSEEPVKNTRRKIAHFNTSKTRINHITLSVWSARVCACVCVCVRLRVNERVRECVCVCVCVRVHWFTPNAPHWIRINKTGWEVKWKDFIILWRIITVLCARRYE